MIHLNVIEVTDWSSIQKQLPSDTFIHSERSNTVINLGIYSKNNGYRSKGYVGVVRLKVDAKGERNTQIETVLKVSPRFPSLNPVHMLQVLSNDDEFPNYLAAMQQTNNPLFHFFKDQPIKLHDTILEETNLITVMLFLNSLKKLCMKPLYGCMVRVEENMVSKVKGKIVIHKHIKQNVLKARADRIYCAYQKYKTDILENQYLKMALFKVRKFIERNNIVMPELEALVSYCTKVLQQVSMPNRKLNRKALTKMRGLYAYYNNVLDYAEMIDREFAMDCTGSIKQTGFIVPYAINMQMLFEVYVRYRLKQYLKNGPLKMKPFLDSKRVLQNEDLYISGKIIPDIILTYNNVVYSVLDVKYKNLYKEYHSNVREDRLQLLAYGLMYNPLHIGHIFPGENIRNHKYSVVTDTKITYHELVIGGVNDKGTFKAEFICDPKM